MGEPTTQRADEIPGGLWLLVPLRAVRDVWDPHDGGIPFASEGEDCTVVEVDGTRHLHCNGDVRPLAAFDLADFAVVIDDPLGLGLAGLRARIAERLPPSPGVVHWTLGARIRHTRIPRRVMSTLFGADHEGRLGDLTPAEVSAVASYIALVHRLCGLVGLELEPREVARWHADRCDQDHGCWWLSTEAGAVNVCELPADPDMRSRQATVPALAGITDPLEALRAAVREMEVRRG